MENVINLNKEGLYLALGGGAARGLAHLGILKALQESRIPIAGICGTSMGALVGACYALAPDADHVINDFKEYIHSTHYHRARYSFMRAAQKRDNEKRSLSFLQKLETGLLFGRSMTTGSIISFENYSSEINALVANRTFQRLKIPFFAVAVDLLEQKEVLFNQGLLRSAILASSAIPGAFPAIRDGRTIYVDGGWVNKVPVLPLKFLGAEKVLAVDVFFKEASEFNPKRGYTIINMANNVTEKRLLELQVEPASILWRPPVSDLHWAEFTQVEKAVDAGYTFAMARMDEVRHLLAPRPKPKWWVAKLEKFVKRMLPPEEPEPAPRFPFEVRAIWDVTSAED